MGGGYICAMTQALARAWSCITLLERFSAIALIKLWVIAASCVLTFMANVAIVAGEVFSPPLPDRDRPCCGLVVEVGARPRL